MRDSTEDALLQKAFTRYLFHLYYVLNCRIVTAQIVEFVELIGRLRDLPGILTIEKGNECLLLQRPT